jgi:sigma-54 dependent transcriptional regulator, acetoin dehydrogenase operon transcriptional activator AcoR
LRVLQERHVTPIGGGKTVEVDFSLICATHHKLRDSVDQGIFRSDLYYRINGLTVNLPALRERTDFHALTERILTEHNPERTVHLQPALLAKLSRHSWPGNIRQYSSLLRTASAMLNADEDRIDWQHLPDDLLDELAAEAAPILPDSTFPQNLKALSLAVIQQSLQDSHGNVSAAARCLGISRQTLYRKIALARQRTSH